MTPETFHLLFLRPSLGLTDLAGRTVHQALEIHSSLHPPCWDDGVPPCLALYMGARDLNWGSNACVGTT